MGKTVVETPAAVASGVWGDASAADAVSQDAALLRTMGSTTVSVMACVFGAHNHSNTHTGITIALHNKLFPPTTIISIAYPPTPEHQGRGLALRTKTTHFDILHLAL